ncbi:esterase family protein [Actinomadura rudentiformis]|uniref:Esterase family protein n=2 Tax=Actinomadura rudentiformis TaxID=359158 RepID=A0A6H9YXL4_9ACTN|nr:esterase family protein [Actinomadura rudentiformis]
MASERRRLRMAALATTVTGTIVAGALLAPAEAGAAALRKADTGAAITAQKRIDARTFDATVRSPALRTSVKVRVITPKGWSRTSKKRWPVLYAYHGGNDSYISWTRSTDIEKLAARYNVMVVMPEGGVNGSYTDWYNYGKGGTPMWETFHTKEVIQLMERNYRAGTARAAMGLSSGGQGAITYAARHRGLFRYAASYSGIVHLTKPGIPAIIMAEGFVFNPGQDPFRIWGKPDKHARNWQQHDPYVLAKNLRGTGIYLSSGTTGNPGKLDPPFVGWEFVKARLVGGISEAVAGATNVSLAARLRQLKIPVTTHIYKDGWHQWGYWIVEMNRSWPLMMKAIGAKRTS